LARGGYRKPSNPAPVGMPGALSQRTDGGPADKQPARYISGLPYGEGQEMMETQESAPMAADAPSMQQAESIPGQPVIPLSERSQNLEEPITAGSNVGPGPGQGVLGLPNIENMLKEDVINVMKYLPMLELMANNPDASNSLRLLVKYLKSQAE
jgi:hypothetical protein